MVSRNNCSPEKTTKNNSKSFHISKHDGVLRTAIHEYTGLNYDEKKRTTRITWEVYPSQKLHHWKNISPKEDST